MSDASALLAAIRAAPEDDAPRLVYADWLEEHGQPERAEFIRAQCELARTENAALRRREAELLAVHHDAFAGPLAAPHLRFRFHRGFIAGFGHSGVFSARDPQSNSATGTDLRFFPDGHVRYADAWVRENEWEGNLRALRNWDVWPVCRYDLWAVEDHAEIAFDFLDAFIPCSFRGWLWATGLCLERTEFGFDRRPLLQDFVHEPVPDLDSFPET